MPPSSAPRLWTLADAQSSQASVQRGPLNRLPERGHQARSWGPSRARRRSRCAKLIPSPTCFLVSSSLYTTHNANVSIVAFFPGAPALTGVLADEGASRRCSGGPGKAERAALPRRGGHLLPTPNNTLRSNEFPCGSAGGTVTGRGPLTPRRGQGAPRAQRPGHGLFGVPTPTAALKR